MKYPKWHCCSGRDEAYALEDQGYLVPSTSRTDREIILSEIDWFAKQALEHRRQESKEPVERWKGFEIGMALANSLAAESLAIAAGIASRAPDDYHLKYFREQQAKIRPVVGLKPGSPLDAPDKQRAGDPAKSAALVADPAGAALNDRQDACPTLGAA